MFRQSIDPRGSFPPRSTKKPPSSKKPIKKKKGTKKPKIKRRKRTKDRFATERKAEQVFRFGERRSGLSGRTLNKPEGRTQPRQPPPSRNDNRNNFNPADYLRIHNQAIKNQLRDIAETKATGGTFTGTSIGEEKRVKEAKEADLEFKRQEADTRRRFVGAVERLADRPIADRPAPAPARAPEPEPEPAPILEKKKLNPPPIPKKSKKKVELVGYSDGEELPDPTDRFELDEVNQRAADSMLEEFGDGETAPIGTQTESIQTTTTQTQTERRPPEDDINYLATTRSKRTPFEAPSVPAPRTSPSNPITKEQIDAIRALHPKAIPPTSPRPTLSRTNSRVKEPEPEPEPDSSSSDDSSDKLFISDDSSEDISDDSSTESDNIGGDQLLGKSPDIADDLFRTDSSDDDLTEAYKEVSEDRALEDKSTLTDLKEVYDDRLAQFALEAEEQLPEDRKAFQKSIDFYKKLMEEEFENRDNPKTDLERTESSSSGDTFNFSDSDKAASVRGISSDEESDPNSDPDGYRLIAEDNAEDDLAIKDKKQREAKYQERLEDYRLEIEEFDDEAKKGLDRYKELMNITEVQEGTPPDSSTDSSEDSEDDEGFKIGSRGIDLLRNQDIGDGIADAVGQKRYDLELEDLTDESNFDGDSDDSEFEGFLAIAEDYAYDDTRFGSLEDIRAARKARLEQFEKDDDFEIEEADVLRKRYKELMREAVERAKNPTPPSSEQDSSSEDSVDLDEDFQTPRKRIENRLQRYQELSEFGDRDIQGKFDNEKKHYRLVVLEDVEPQEVGRQKSNSGFKKGDQFRLKSTDYAGLKTNKGYSFYKDNTGKQMVGSASKNTFRINLKTQGRKIEKAIEDGKIKIVFDEFEDEI